MTGRRFAFAGFVAADRGLEFNGPQEAGVCKRAVPVYSAPAFSAVLATGHELELIIGKWTGWRLAAGAPPHFFPGLERSLDVGLGPTFAKGGRRPGSAGLRL